MSRNKSSSKSPYKINKKDESGQRNKKRKFGEISKSEKPNSKLDFFFDNSAKKKKV